MTEIIMQTGNIIPFLLLLLICPLSHFLLIPMMSKKRHYF
ncbi:DUF2933 domain-containing protein [Paenibacillus timonensis]|nr:DUF2933 domain-containing protein [Paenibacillus timonensis]